MKSSLKEFCGTHKGIFIFIPLLGIIFFGAYKLWKNTKTEPLKNEMHCAQYIYYNPIKRIIDTAYSPIIIYGDSIINLTTPMGKTWSSKDFLSMKNVKKMMYQ